LGDRRPLIAGNWKLNGTRSSAAALATGVRDGLLSDSIDVLLCPVTVHMALVQELIAHCAIRLGGQNCSDQEAGAFTGEVSAQMLAEAGCEYVIVVSEVIGEQLDALLSLAGVQAFSKLVVAYEPVWAIGTGKTATPEQAQAVHAMIRQRIAEHDPAVANALVIQYGGSVKPDNAASLFSQPDIDGGLIGGAALDADSFLAICAAAS